MNDGISSYLSSLGMSRPVEERVLQLLADYRELLGAEIKDAFISEYVSGEAGRVFESLFAFTDELIMEAKISEEAGDRLDFVPLRRSVRHWIIEKRDYDLRTAEEPSRISMEVWLADSRVANLRASGPNCAALVRIGATYIRPNLAALSSGG